MIQDANTAFSTDQSTLKYCSALRCRPPSPLPSPVRYTNRPFGHQRGHTKRLIIAGGLVQIGGCDTGDTGGEIYTTMSSGPNTAADPVGRAPVTRACTTIS